jgi:complex III assembly factor LYRM7
MFSVSLISVLTKPTGDAPILAAAQQQIRHEFRQKSSLNSSDASTQEAIEHAQEVANFLKANVVQGKRMDGGDNMYSESGPSQF